jgi:hypothetical protein
MGHVVVKSAVLLIVIAQRASDFREVGSVLSKRVA